MSKLKIASSFVKIRLHNIGTLLLKTATTYAVAGFGAIQLSSIVVDNISTEEVLGLTPESFMQILFIGVLVGFPIVLVAAYIFKKKYYKRTYC